MQKRKINYLAVNIKHAIHQQETWFNRWIQAMQL